MEHSFNIEIAKRFGVDEAIIIHNIYFWVLKNKANNKHFYDGNYWTYNSIDAFAELFPYFTNRQIERILKNAVNKGILIKGNYNKSNYDRTSWYGVTQTVESIYANGGMETHENVNGVTQTVVTIPYNNTDNNKLVINNNIDNRKLKFADSLKPFLDVYGKDMLNDFYAYWTEHGDNDKKMRYEKEKSFGLSRRLTTWNNNKFNNNKNGKHEQITEFTTAIREFNPDA